MTTPEEIAQRAKALRSAALPSAQEDRISTSHGGMAMRIAIELIASLTAGAMIGWFVDDWLGTSPVFLLICLMLGTVAGFVTMKRVNDAFAAELEKSEQIHNETLDK